MFGGIPPQAGQISAVRQGQQTLVVQALGGGDDGGIRGLVNLDTLLIGRKIETYQSVQFMNQIWRIRHCPSSLVKNQ